MKNLLKIVVMLLPYVLDWIDDYMRERKRAERQAKRDKANDNPAAAFADHFGDGVQPVEGKAGDAAATGKADDRG